MIEQESLKREFDILEDSLKEAKQLLAQFPDDWILSTHISRAEHRLQALQSMQVQWNTQPNASARP